MVAARAPAQAQERPRRSACSPATGSQCPAGAPAPRSVTPVPKSRTIRQRNMSCSAPSHRRHLLARRWLRKQRSRCRPHALVQSTTAGSSQQPAASTSRTRSPVPAITSRDLSVAAADHTKFLERPAQPELANPQCAAARAVGREEPRDRLCTNVCSHPGTALPRQGQETAWRRGPAAEAA